MPKNKEIVSLTHHEQPVKVELLQKTAWFRDYAVPVSALFVSLFALFISVWAAVETQEHDRLSVMPALHFGGDTGGEIDDAYLENNGLGPAMITSVSIKLNGHPIKDFEEFGQKISYLYLSNPDKWGWQHLNFSYPLKAGERLKLYWKASKELDDQKLQDILRDQLCVEITYCSLYKDCQPYRAESCH